MTVRGHIPHRPRASYSTSNTLRESLIHADTPTDHGIRDPCFDVCTRAAAERTRVTVWRDPSCGCCSGWVAHLQAEGFAVDDQVVRALGPVRRRLGTPSDLLSCHAGQAEGFALEGHVPAIAIRRLLAERPTGVRGLSVPAMPLGSTGMEVPGQPADTYAVVAFGEGPHRDYMRFTGANPS